jgi:hypothetical protein
MTTIRKNTRGRKIRNMPGSSIQGKAMSNDLEMKAIDTAISVAADTTGSLTLLDGCSKGTDLNQRVARQITVRSLQMILRPRVTPTTGVDQYHRVMLVKDLQPNGAIFGITDLLISASHISLTNLSNQMRFKILFDRTFMLNASGESFSGRIFRENIKTKFTVQYNSGNAGTIADIATSSLYLLVIGSEAAGVTAGTVSGNVRVRYTD